MHIHHYNTNHLYEHFTNHNSWKKLATAQNIKMRYVWVHLSSMSNTDFNGNKPLTHQMVILQDVLQGPVSWLGSNDRSVVSGQAYPGHLGTQSHSWSGHWPSGYWASEVHQSAWDQSRSASGTATGSRWVQPLCPGSSCGSRHVGGPTQWSGRIHNIQFT